MNEAEIRYSNQSRQLNRYGVTFLEDLYSKGKVRIDFKGKKKWFCNAADVLNNIRVD